MADHTMASNSLTIKIQTFLCSLSCSTSTPLSDSIRMLKHNHRNNAYISWPKSHKLRILHNPPTASLHNTQSRYRGHHCTVLTHQDKNIHVCTSVVKSCVPMHTRFYDVHMHMYVCACLDESAQCNGVLL